MIKRENLKKWILPLIAGGLIILAALMMVSRTAVDRVEVLLPDGSVLLAELADSPEEHLFGLFQAGNLPEDRGVLLVYEEAGIHKLWSRTLRSPIDLVWMDPNRKVVRVDADVRPCLSEPCPVYEPEEAVRFVLQLAAGAAGRHGLRPGISLEFRRLLPPEGSGPGRRE